MGVLSLCEPNNIAILGKMAGRLVNFDIDI